ncbi:hypothetical protein CALK_0697 [Chitinivibrio alkaliphilus ACht1]|uniref:Uncharacterized protein n=1 Tax=Chitinivibrio alkaliphilus ACht1 TaxID=1313304 RepID=U7DCQ7_9BACT|nr:hypothetical protein CALK_0697 [Chitinivibrio alkaliphilus ACht1]
MKVSKIVKLVVVFKAVKYIYNRFFSTSIPTHYDD